MPMHPDRWEHGSELHWQPLPPADTPATHPWSDRDAALVGSGRDALRLVIAHGVATRRWRRLWLPTYLCQEVVTAAVDTGLSCRLYPDRPGEDPTIQLPTGSLEPGDAVLAVNHFGLRAGVASPLPGGVDLVEDHTHDPWSRWARQSSAAYAIASLRKTLPVPDGGVVWSPAGLPVPGAPPVTPERERGSSRKLAGMLLKAAYLDGAAVAKDDFRRLAVAGEGEIASGPISGMAQATRALLPAFPVEAWRAARAANVAHLANALAGRDAVRVLGPAPEGGVAFSGLLVFATPALRDAGRGALVAHRVYPAGLWPLDEAPLDGITDPDRDLAARSLSVHCDARYTTSDLDRVVGALAPDGEDA